MSGRGKGLLADGIQWTNTAPTYLADHENAHRLLADRQQHGRQDVDSTVNLEEMMNAMNQLATDDIAKARQLAAENSQLRRAVYLGETEDSVHRPTGVHLGETEDSVHRPTGVHLGETEDSVHRPTGVHLGETEDGKGPIAPFVETADQPMVSETQVENHVPFAWSVHLVDAAAVKRLLETQDGDVNLADGKGSLLEAETAESAALLTHIRSLEADNRRLEADNRRLQADKRGYIRQALAIPNDLLLLASGRPNDLSTMLAESSHVLIALGLLAAVVAGVVYRRLAAGAKKKEKPSEWNGYYHEI